MEDDTWRRYVPDSINLPDAMTKAGWDIVQHFIYSLDTQQIVKGLTFSLGYNRMMRRKLRRAMKELH